MRTYFVSPKFPPEICTITLRIPRPLAVVTRPLIDASAAVGANPLTIANGDSEVNPLFVQIVRVAKLILAKFVRFIHTLFSRCKIRRLLNASEVVIEAD